MYIQLYSGCLAYFFDMHCLPSSFEHCVILAAYSLTAMFCVSCIIALHLLTYFMKCLTKYFVVFSEDLRQHFEKFGDISDCVVSLDSVTGRSKGFGFVTFSDSSVVDQVMKFCVLFRVQ